MPRTKHGVSDAESARLQALDALGGLDSGRDALMDGLVHVAALITGMPMAAVTLLDEDRQWFKASVGLACTETSRQDSFCTHTIDGSGVLVVGDAASDARFEANPLVLDDPRIRFYAGAPLTTTAGQSIGALCVMDTVPRRLTDSQLDALRALAAQAIALLEFRRVSAVLTEALGAAEDARRDARLVSGDLDVIFDQLPMAAALYDLDGFAMRVNTASAALLGRTRQEIEGQHRSTWLPAGDAQAMDLWDRFRAGTQSSALHETTILRAGKEPLTMLASSTLVRDSHGSPRCVLVMAEDIEERRRAEDELFEAQSTVDGVITVGPDGNVEAWNRGAERMFGWTRLDMLGHSLSRILPPELHQQHAQNLARVGAGQPSRLDGHAVRVVGVRADGSSVPVEVTVTQWTRDGVRHSTAILRDISEQVAAEQERERRARTDALTGLYSRDGLVQANEAVTARRGRGRELLAAIVLDLDRFHEVNETFTHDQGDELLVKVGHAVRGFAVEHRGFAGRLAGDEFAVLLPIEEFSDDAGTAATERLTSLADELARAVAGPHALVGVPIVVECSSGVAWVRTNDGGHDPAEVLRRASSAVQDAKQQRDRVAAWSPTASERAAGRLELLAELRQAIPAGELRLHYQPLISVGHTDMVRMEALVRWQHPRRGLLGPGEFLPVAEPTRLIVPLTEWVIDEALRQRSLWLAAQNGDSRTARQIGIAVNVSPRTFTRIDIPALVEQALRRHECPADQLTLEITETALSDDPAAASKALAALRNLGVRVAIDDYGTGFTSLATLRDAQVDEIKIDMSYVRGLTESTRDQAIVANTAALGRSLGLEVTAEGVEDAETAQLLIEAGCDYLQGYHFARPTPPAALSVLEAASIALGCLRAGYGTGLGMNAADRSRSTVDSLVQ